MADWLTSPGCGKRQQTLAVLAIFVGVAFWSTWPLARQPLQTLPLGASPGPTVPMFNLWTIWWNSDWCFGDQHRESLSYWNAPVFYPTPSAFAFSEPQPTTIAVAPVIWLTGSRTLAYNIYLWLGLVLNGVLTWKLLRFLGIQKVIAAGGGVAMILLPIVHWQRDVLQTVPVWGILWTWLALVKLGRDPTVKRGLESGTAFAVSFLMCGHHGLFLAVLLAGTAWLLLRYRDQRRTWRSLLTVVTVVTVAGIITAPFVIPLKNAARDNGFERRQETVDRLSARPLDYSRTHAWQLIDPQLTANTGGMGLSPGTMKIVLAVLGTGFGLRRRRWRRWTGFLVMTALLACLLSQGTQLEIAGWKPWNSLVETVPGFSQVRSAFRFGWFVQMAVVLLAAQGLHWLLVLARRTRAAQPGRRLVPRGLTGVAVLLGLTAIFETVPQRVLLAEVPDMARHADWMRFVQTETPAGKAILCLPMAATSRVADFSVTTRWMFFQTTHRVPLVNGYSGFFPADYFRLRNKVRDRLPDEDVLAELTQQNVELIVVDRFRFPSERFDVSLDEIASLERVFEDRVANVDIYRLRAGPDRATP
ncbi:MAG: hypothetical protein VB858_19030 [Planctomycetaceae bacterium]